MHDLREKIGELQENGFCVLRKHFALPLIEACRRAFWPHLLAYLKANSDKPNGGENRHFVPMPFEPPCFAREFFFDESVLAIARAVLGDRIAADQWGCDIPLRGSSYQGLHVDYRHPLFGEAPDLVLPMYFLVVSFGLVPITLENGPIEIAPGTHRIPGQEAFRAVESGEIGLRPVPLELGDVLIRHPWGLHRGSPNRTDRPRALVTIRYTRHWYADESREVNSIPHEVWDALSVEQRKMMRFPITPCAAATDGRG